jgi:hypothetical protein
VTRTITRTIATHSLYNRIFSTLDIRILCRIFSTVLNLFLGHLLGLSLISTRNTTLNTSINLGLIWVSFNRKCLSEILITKIGLFMAIRAFKTTLLRIFVLGRIVKSYIDKTKWAEGVIIIVRDQLSLIISIEYDFYEKFYQQEKLGIFFFY